MTSKLTATLAVHAASILMLVVSAVSNYGKPPLDTEQVARPRSIHAQLGDPQRREVLIRREGYDLLYDCNRRSALWTQYRIVPSDLDPKVPSMDRFTIDRDIPAPFRTHPQDYLESGYDRGHLVPEADQRRNLTTLAQAMIVSNASPQAPGLNRNAWRDIEKKVREMAREADETVVVTGPIFDSLHCTIGHDDSMVVPGGFFKAVAFRHGPYWRTQCWVAQQNDGSADIKTLAVSLIHVEQLTGFELFAELGISVENKRGLYSGPRKDDGFAPVNARVRAWPAHFVFESDSAGRSVCPDGRRADDCQQSRARSMAGLARSL